MWDLLRDAENRSSSDMSLNAGKRLLPTIPACTKLALVTDVTSQDLRLRVSMGRTARLNRFRLLSHEFALRRNVAASSKSPVLEVIGNDGVGHSSSAGRHRRFKASKHIRQSVSIKSFLTITWHNFTSSTRPQHAGDQVRRGTDTLKVFPTGPHTAPSGSFRTLSPVPVYHASG